MWDFGYNEETMISLRDSVNGIVKGQNKSGGVYIDLNIENDIDNHNEIVPAFGYWTGIYSVDTTTGEIVNERLHHNNRKRFKSDTPFDNNIVPYLIMLFCATVDGVVFYSLFSRISYDSPMMLGVQIAGFLFGFDVVPIFIGIQYKRLRQGITKDRFVLIMALVVCGLAFAMNIALRLMTIDLISPSTASAATSYMGTVTQETADSGIDATAIALTIFGMGIPVVTSLGSCLISFITYNPLGIKKQRTAEMMEDTRDEVRRFDAILDDYDAEPDFAENLEAEDEAKYQEMQMMHKAQVIGYCDYVRERLKEQLSNPTSNNVLSESVCETILARLDRELGMLNTQAASNNKTVTPSAIDLQEEKEHVYTTMIRANKAIV